MGIFQKTKVNKNRKSRKFEEFCIFSIHLTCWHVTNWTNLMRSRKFCANSSRSTVVNSILFVKNPILELKLERMTCNLYKWVNYWSVNASQQTKFFDLTFNRWISPRIRRKLEEFRLNSASCCCRFQQIDCPKKMMNWQTAASVSNQYENKYSPPKKLSQTKSINFLM